MTFPRHAQLQEVADEARAAGDYAPAVAGLMEDAERAEAAEASAVHAADRELDDATPDAVLIAAAVDPLAALPRHLAVEALRQLAARLHLPATYADGTPIQPLDGAA